LLLFNKIACVASCGKNTLARRQSGEAQVPPDKIIGFQAGAAIRKILFAPAYRIDRNAKPSGDIAICRRRWAFIGESRSKKSSKTPPTGSASSPYSRDRNRVGCNPPGSPADIHLKPLNDPGSVISLAGSGSSIE